MIISFVQWHLIMWEILTHAMCANQYSCNISHNSLLILRIPYRPTVGLLLRLTWFVMHFYSNCWTPIFRVIQAVSRTNTHTPLHLDSQDKESDVKNTHIHTCNRRVRTQCQDKWAMKSMTAGGPKLNLFLFIQWISKPFCSVVWWTNSHLVSYLVTISNYYFWVLLFQ